MKYSIIIPTYSHLSDLQVCCESLQTTTPLQDTEIIIVANGCTDDTDGYIKSLGQPFKLLWFPAPLGYTKAVNEGLKVATGEYIILLNNDIKILDSTWIKILRKPFETDKNTGITGPVKFFWDCGGIQRNAIAFWCAMFKKSLLEEIGLLCEDFSPGMGEDGDFSIKTELIGYKLVQVPTDGSTEFGSGIPHSEFPIWHKGNGTFGDTPDLKDKLIQRNNKILVDRFSSRLEKIYNICLSHPCDINVLFPILRRYANRCEHVTEFGVRGVFSTYGLMASRSPKMVSYDIYTDPNIQEAIDVAKESGVDFKFIEQDVLKADIEETDLLFIDTLHTYGQLSQELARHANKVKKYILLHDTATFGTIDDDTVTPGEKIQTDKHGLRPAITEFLQANPEWAIIEDIEESNGLVILERKKSFIKIVGPEKVLFDDQDEILEKEEQELGEILDSPNMMIPENIQPILEVSENPFPSSIFEGTPKFSIVVPCSGATARDCVEKILKYTSFTNKELIIVSNGCDPDTVQYFRGLENIIFIDFGAERKGQIIPVLEGYKRISGEFLVLIDDDTLLLDQPVDTWINRLYESFSDPTVGIAGPFIGDYPYLGKFIHSGCTMYKKDIIDEVGGFDLEYGYGYLYDVDISASIQKKYRAVFVGEDGAFPIFHPGSPVDVVAKKERVELMRINRERLYMKHGKRPRFSIVVPTYGEHLEDCLRPCLESVKQYTNLEDVEIIVVANGCTDDTATYVDYLGYPFKLLWFDKGLGYTRATNEGIKVARGNFIILLNNDTQILDKGLAKGTWIKMLEEPFLKDDKVGLTGPLELFDQYAGDRVLIFFCTMIKREVFEKIAIYEEI
jgi:glycosyltransferase involved in cell wall biosynthesis